MSGPDDQRLGPHEAMAYAAVRQFPGVKTAELARLTGMDAEMLWRRLPDLRRRGFVTRDAEGLYHLGQRAEASA